MGSAIRQILGWYMTIRFIEGGKRPWKVFTKDEGKIVATFRTKRAG